MKRIINNTNNLTKESLDMTTNKVRAIILNNLYITIVDYSNILMMPGGKIEPGETPVDAVKRELMEETTINILLDDIDQKIAVHPLESSASIWALHFISLSIISVFSQQHAAYIKAVIP